MSGINLSKGQSINLKKNDGGSLTRVSMGLGWDVAKPKGLLGSLFGSVESIDLDASVIGYDENGRRVDVVYFGKLTGFNGACRHSGDDRSGGGSAQDADEIISVDLSKLPSNVTALIFTVNSYTGQTFEKVANAFCSLTDDVAGKEIARINLSGTGSHSGMAMSALIKRNGGWEMKAIAEICNGPTIDAIEPALQRIRATL